MMMMMLQERRSRSLSRAIGLRTRVMTASISDEFGTATADENRTYRLRPATAAAIDDVDEPCSRSGKSGFP